jgi:hypothetical protein
MPTEEQIRRWEVLEFMAETRGDYNYLISHFPLNKEHEEWLQNRFGDTASPRGVSAVANGSEASECKSAESGLASNKTP